MPDLGLDVLLKGKNLIRILGGLGVALKISLISVAISIPLGILLGALMTWKNPVCKAPRTKSPISAVPQKLKTMMAAVSASRFQPKTRVVPKYTTNSSTICGIIRTFSR